MFAAVAALLIGLGGLFVALRNDLSRTSITTITAASMAAMAFTAIQCLTAFELLNVEWEEPAKGFLQALKLLALDLKVLKLDCYSSSTANNYLFQLLMFPMMIAAVLVMWGLSLVWDKLMKTTPIDFVNVKNLIGMIATVLYISFTVISFKWLHCYNHPNGQSSMWL